MFASCEDESEGKGEDEGEGDGEGAGEDDGEVRVRVRMRVRMKVRVRVGVRVKLRIRMKVRRVGEWSVRSKIRCPRFCTSPERKPPECRASEFFKPCCLGSFASRVQFSCLGFWSVNWLFCREANIFSSRNQMRPRCNRT